MFRVMVSRDGDAFQHDVVKIYVKKINSDGVHEMLLPVKLTLSSAVAPNTTLEFDPTLTIPTELAEALLSQLAWHFFGGNDDNQTGDLVSRIKKLTAELSRERIRFDKLLAGISNLSVMRDGPST